MRSQRIKYVFFFLFSILFFSFFCIHSCQEDGRNSLFQECYDEIQQMGFTGVVTKIEFNNGAGYNDQLFVRYSNFTGQRNSGCPVINVVNDSMLTIGVSKLLTREIYYQYQDHYIIKGSKILKNKNSIAIFFECQGKFVEETLIEE